MTVLRKERTNLKEHPPVYQEVGGPSLTRREFLKECDINVIVERYVKGVEPNGFSEAQVYWGEDFAAVPDFLHAMDAVAKAEQAFDALPAAVRRRFDNDPAKALEFVGKMENMDEAHTLGMIAPERYEAYKAAKEAAAGASPPSPAGPPVSGGHPPSKT